MPRKKITDIATAETERIRRITNTPTIVPADPADDDEPTKPTAKGKGKGKTTSKATPKVAYTPQYMPAPELWWRTIEQLRVRTYVSMAQMDSWLKPCRLILLELPTGHTIAARLRTPTEQAADHIRARWAADIRAILMQLTGKGVVLFIRGHDTPPPDKRGRFDFAA